MRSLEIYYSAAEMNGNRNSDRRLIEIYYKIIDVYKSWLRSCHSESAVEVKREKKILVAPSKDNKYAGLRWKHNEPRTRKLNMATKRGSREPVDVNSNSQVDLR